MSLRDVKVGDEVMILHAFPPGMHKVTAVGRKWVTANDSQYSIETGQQKGPVYGHSVYAYTIAQWARRGLDSALRSAASRVENRSRQLFGHLTDAEVTEMTATLQGIAEKLEKR